MNKNNSSVAIDPSHRAAEVAIRDKARSMITLILLTCMCGFCSWAQNPVLQMDDLEFDTIRSPDYGSQSHRRATATHEDWFQISLEYEVAGRNVWLDEVELEWHVLLDSAEGKVYLGKKITYKDVPGDDHYAVVYLRPKFVQRYGHRERIDKRDLKVMVIARVDGREVERYHYPTRKPESEWWEIGRVSGGMIVKDNDLLARTETPFAPLDWDFYQDIKSYAPISRKDKENSESGK